MNEWEDNRKCVCEEMHYLAQMTFLKKPNFKHLNSSSSVPKFEFEVYMKQKRFSPT